MCVGTLSMASVTDKGISFTYRSLHYPDMLAARPYVVMCPQAQVEVICCMESSLGTDMQIEMTMEIAMWRMLNSWLDM